MEEEKDEVTAKAEPEGKRAWMLTWNPDAPQNDWNLQRACEDTHKGIGYTVYWQCHGKHAKPGDDVYLMKSEGKENQGIAGIVAHGHIIYPREALVGVTFDWFQETPDESLTREKMKEYPTKSWSPYAGQSGDEITEPARSALREKWNEFRTSKQEKGLFLGLGAKKASPSVACNSILYGPPGTGKTYSTVVYAVDIIEGKSADEIAADLQSNRLKYNEFLAKYKILRNADRIAFTTFHQSYGYEEFIEGIRPSTDEKTKAIRYDIEAGVFKDFCEKAKEQPELPFVFIIDEINRGNISKIFGELITLIEDAKRAGAAEGMEATLPYSKDPFSVPQNVYILGTMNTADRSIALMDTALRRRFSFIEMMPRPELLEHAKVNGVDIEEMLKAINERIEFLYDREHTIGHAFFMGLKKDLDIEHLSTIFQKKVLPLLQEYFYDDYQKIQLVLGDNAKKHEFKFIQDAVKRPTDVFHKSAALGAYDAKTLFTINKDAFSKPESYRQIYEAPKGPTDVKKETATEAAAGAAKDEAK